MDRYRSAKVASLLGIIGNIFLSIIKCIVGFMCHSQAMISDAFNSFSDVFSSLLTYIGSKIASRKPDDDHNLGHGKAEYIFSLLISLVMIELAAYITYQSFISLFTKTNYTFSVYLLFVCIITILVKATLYLYTRHLYRKCNNILIFANSIDHFNDILLTSCNLIAVICAIYGYTFVDGLVGTIISIFILKEGIELFKKSYDVLMDKTMSSEIKDKIYNIINNNPQIVDINHFNSTPVGYQYQISLTIFVDGTLSTFESHEIANKLEKEICEIDEVFLAVIHVNPIKKDSYESSNL